MKTYFDTSALAKRYIAEPGSERVDELYLRVDSILVGSIYLPEVISLLSRAARLKRLDARQYEACKAAVIKDLRTFDICQLSSEVIHAAVSVLEKCPLKAADAIHIASAIEMRAARFVSADVKQLEAARMFKLTVECV